jgi:hypothetical protein
MYRIARACFEQDSVGQDPSRNRSSIVLSGTNHLSYLIGQAVLGLE